MFDFSKVPPNLPAPVDNGECDHLVGLSLPYSLLSDAQFDFAKALSLPTFSVYSRVFLKRVTLICRDGIITDCVYPVFPSNSDVELVLSMFS